MLFDIIKLRIKFLNLLILNNSFSGSLRLLALCREKASIIVVEEPCEDSASEVSIIIIIISNNFF